MKQQTLDKIIEAIKMSNSDINVDTITAETRFSDLPNMDSMSIVNFQLDLASIIGEKANEALPMPEMTIGEYGDLIESL